MRIYYLSLILAFAFKENPYAKLIRLHQTSAGWLGVIEDTHTGQTYTMLISPVKEMTVVPQSADELLKMNQQGA